VPTTTSKKAANGAPMDEKQPISVLFDRVMVQISQVDGQAS
jgi:hypothetical protein